MAWGKGGMGMEKHQDSNKTRERAAIDFDPCEISTVCISIESMIIWNVWSEAFLRLDFS